MTLINTNQIKNTTYVKKVSKTGFLEQFEQKIRPNTQQNNQNRYNYA
jgi:hypothetical protein